MRRPEHFAAIDVAPFERHEAEIGRLSAMTGEAFDAGFAALSDEARHLCAIPVHHLDLARNTRLLPLSLVYDAATVAGDNILIKGTVLVLPMPPTSPRAPIPLPTTSSPTTARSSPSPLLAGRTTRWT